MKIHTFMIDFLALPQIRLNRPKKYFYIAFIGVLAIDWEK